MRKSDWKFDTSAGVGGAGGAVGVGLAAGAGHGWIYLKPPGGGQVKFEYTSAGVGLGAVGKLKLPETGFEGLSVSTKDHLSAGAVYMLDDFNGKELETDDFVGGCLILELSATVAFFGGAITGMALGYDRSFLLYLASGAATGPMGGELVSKLLGLQTGANAFLPMVSTNASLGYGASLIGSVGYWKVSSVEELSVQEPDVPYSGPHSASKVANTEKVKSMEIAGDGLFQFDKDTIMSAADANKAGVPIPEVALAMAGMNIKSRPNWRVRVIGHTDEVGSDDYNMDLSKRRAKTVAQWLIARGYVTAANIGWDGKGKSKPKDLAHTAKAHQANRRVEIWMVAP